MKFSIIVPVYNVEKYINKCIDSIFNQKFNDYEIIAVNDGSKDGSGIILDSFANKISLLKVIHQQNKGLGGARNTGIENAKGDYIVLLDSDDYIHPDMLFELNSYIDKYDLDVLAFDFIRVTEEGKEIDRATNSRYLEEYSTVSKKEFMLFEPTSCTKVYRKQIFDKYNIRFPERLWYEDFATIYKVIPYVEKIGYLKKPFYYYVQRDGSITHSVNSKRMLEIIDAFNYELKFFKEKKLFNEYYDELEWNCALHVLYYSAFRLLIPEYHKKEMSRLYKYAYDLFPNIKENKYVKENLKNRYHLDLIINEKMFIFYFKNSIYPKLATKIKKIIGFIKQETK